MCYSYSYQLSNVNFQGTASSASANTPISFGSTSSTICFDASYRASGSFGSSSILSNYTISSSDVLNGTTFIGAFVYITLNNSVLNL